MAQGTVHLGNEIRRKIEIDSLLPCLLVILLKTLGSNTLMFNILISNMQFFSFKLFQKVKIN